jgi:dienelactone hydrolase
MLDELKEATPFIRSKAGLAGAVLHTPPSPPRPSGIIIFLAGLGKTKEKLAWSTRCKKCVDAGFACVLADHYNEGERRDECNERETNRGGWTRCQKALFWRAIANTARTVPELVSFCVATYPRGVPIFAFGSSMGGDILLCALQLEQRLSAVALERATPNWLRPNSTANVLGECDEGDALYEELCPCRHLPAYVHHPTAMLFLCGASDTHVPPACAESFLGALHAAEGGDTPEGKVSAERSLCMLPSRGWQGHVLMDAAEATRRSLEFFAAAAHAHTPSSPSSSSSPPPTSPQPPDVARLPPTLRAADELHTHLATSPLSLVCVYATADWCAPCRRVKAGWEAIAHPDGEAHERMRLGGRISFALANLTEEADEALDGTSLSEALRVTILPSFVLFRHGREVARADGAAHKRPARRLFLMIKKELQLEGEGEFEHR